ncbi:MAG: hypothetical protein OXE17_02380 [Chloroflexi bacterium]|nr:hypothetical protein [Chloroflexota bacterium]
MEVTNQQLIQGSADLAEYFDRILVPEDKPLFEEAVKASKVGALRSAYIVIGLACAESLKRRFKEAAVRDNVAGKIVGQFEDMEQSHKAVDKFLLEEAKEYGFLSGSQLTVLSHIYDMRCVYGHPYEEAPSEEKVIEAASEVVELVLSKPVKLRHGFARDLLKNLLENRSYLDDLEIAVSSFAKRILPRLDEQLYPWFMDQYWNELEKFADDPSMSVFFRRGLWFCHAMLEEVSVALLSSEEWHNKVNNYPKTLPRVCSSSAIFPGIGELAQDSMVSMLLEESAIQPSLLTLVEKLNSDGVLSARQHTRFLDHISNAPINTILKSELSTGTCFENLIDALKAHNWYVQNPAMRMIESNGPENASELTEEQQIDLGRNILQAAEGTANLAIDFLEGLAKGPVQWSRSVVQGVVLESFTNEGDVLRFKEHNLKSVLAILDRIEDDGRRELVEQLTESIRRSTPRSRLNRDDIERVIDLLNNFEWAILLANALDEKVPADARDGN